jgi:uncharacterized protein YcfJ
MKKTILALAAAGLVPLFAHSQEKPAPTRLEPLTTYGDVARVLSSQPVYERGGHARRECRLENTGYTTASPAQDVPRCDASAESGERIVAYDVTYQYHGREFRIRMPYDPGEQMAVNVDVRPPMPDSRAGSRNPRYRGPY